MLTFLSRTSKRKEVKAALKSKNVYDKMQTLESIDFIEIIKEDMKKVKPVEFLKTAAFQIGQCLGLLDGFELYTKNQIAFYYESLEPALKRKMNIEESVVDVERLKNSLITETFISLANRRYEVAQFEE
jgi:chloramphenicol O-acetyltransferase